MRVEAGGGELRVSALYLLRVDRAGGAELVGRGVGDVGDDGVGGAGGDLVGRSEGAVGVDLDAARGEEDRLGVVRAEDDVGGVLLDVEDLGDLPGRPLRRLGVPGQ